MPAVVDSPRQTSNPAIHFEATTRQAKKQVEKLSLPDRRKVMAVLGQAIRPDHCKLVQRLAKLRVYRVAAGETLRITFYLVACEACVIHVGTHPEFDHFVARYRGVRSDQLISIEQSKAALVTMKSGFPGPQCAARLRPAC